MAKQPKNAISPRRDEDYAQWYQEVVKAADMAENSPVRGCMNIKPWGYALWENIVDVLDRRFKATGVKNAYFPVFIPLRFLEKEAEHVEGFAKECAVVTHHRLEKGENGGLVPAGPLTEPYVVRPTSETIIGEAFSRWVGSYRDLPVLVNQWANVVRWEMRTRIFLRTSEFLWQEGHTAHASEAEARERTLQMLDLYEEVAREHLAMPVLKGEKSELERFPGAVNTYCIEAMMQDRKALQAGTSHFLGRNFAKASDIRFQTEKGVEQFAWTTSWGVSTRLVGGLIMTHADDDGMAMPPRVAPAHVVIMPIAKDPEKRAAVMEYAESLRAELCAQTYHGRNVVVEMDDRNVGGRAWDWIKKGIPLRVEVGPRDMEDNAVFAGRRDTPGHKKESIPRGRFVADIAATLDSIQDAMYQNALSFLREHTRDLDDKDAFYAFFTPNNADKPEIHGGFARSGWCGSSACEEKIKEDLAVTIRLIPFDQPKDPGPCVACGRPAGKRVVFAKAY
ncbi:MAG: proline--tRNA ligase [Deltaproteobacteria bacterium]|nr:proline--tRNA ligase [Deltaproteobacteria bacterium]